MLCTDCVLSACFVYLTPVLLSGKFGASSPERERKLLSLAESGRQTRKAAKVSKSSYSLSVASSGQSPGPSPAQIRREGLGPGKSHERSHSDTPPVPVGELQSPLYTQLVSPYHQLLVTMTHCRADSREQQCGQSARPEAGERLQPGQPGGPGGAGEGAAEEAGAAHAGGEAAPCSPPPPGLSDSREGAGGENTEQGLQ